MSPPKINARNIRTAKPSKNKISLVVSPKGFGRPVFMGIDDLNFINTLRRKIGGAPAKHGFGFFIGGTMTADELLGGVVFTNNMRFANSNKIQILSQVQAEAAATFHLVTGFPDTVAGTILFPAGSTIGTLTWSPDPFLLTAGTQLRLRSPTPADVSLAYVSGTVEGDTA
jgi:hypothetical protein